MTNTLNDLTDSTIGTLKRPVLSLAMPATRVCARAKAAQSAMGRSTFG